MQRILKSNQRDSKNFFRQRQERNIFSVDMILQKDRMFPIIRRQKKNPVLRVVYLYKKSGVLRRPHQVDIGEFVIQSPPGGSQQMGGMKTGTKRGADRKIRVSFVLFRFVDIRRPALFLSKFFHPLQPKGIEIPHRKVGARAPDPHRRQDPRPQRSHRDTSAPSQIPPQISGPSVRPIQSGRYPPFLFHLNSYWFFILCYGILSTCSLHFQIIGRDYMAVVQLYNVVFVSLSS